MNKNRNINIYRGTNKYTNNGIWANPYLKTSRRPVDSPLFVHEIADQWFEDTFGIRGRSQTIFCTPSVRLARDYKGAEGSLLQIELPDESNYSLIFSSLVSDFLNITEEISDINNSQQIIDWLTNKNYQRVAKIEEIPEDFEGEIMLYCKEYEVKNIEYE